MYIVKRLLEHKPLLYFEQDQPSKNSTDQNSISNYKQYKTSCIIYTVFLRKDSVLVINSFRFKHLSEDDHLQNNTLERD